jgi:hypothetical protein
MRSLARLDWLAAILLILTSVPLNAQDLEPRRWNHLPVGTNIAVVGFAGKSADIYFNPLIGITDGTADLNAWLARYSHSFDWGGMTARVDGIVPYVSGTWRGLVGGEPGQRTIRAGGDPWLRLSLNFYGAPALRGTEFTDFVAANPVRTAFGASLAVSLPWGAYDSRELINVGANRYVLRPQVGTLHQRGPWSFELTGSVYVFSDNDDFVESTTLSQEPIYALQAHVTRNFKGNFWLGAGMAYAAGGVITLDRTRTDFKVDNLLVNLVGGYRISQNQSVMLAWQRGRTQIDVGTDSDSWLFSWVISWRS